MTTEEMLQQIIDGQKQTNERLDSMDKRLDNVGKRLDKIESDITEMKEEITEIKEDAHVTRVALNALIGKTEDFVRLHDPTYKF